MVAPTMQFRKAAFCGGQWREDSSKLGTPVDNKGLYNSLLSKLESILQAITDAYLKDFQIIFSK